MRIANIPQMAEITIKMVHNDAECSVKTRVLTAYGDGILVTVINRRYASFIEIEE